MSIRFRVVPEPEAVRQGREREAGRRYDAFNEALRKRVEGAG